MTEPAATPPSAEHIAEAMERVVAAGQLPEHPEYGIAERSYVYRTPAGGFGAVHAYFSENRDATWTLNGAGPAWTTPHLPLALYAPQIASDTGPAILHMDEASCDLTGHLFPDHDGFAPLGPHPEEADLRPLRGRDVLVWFPVGTDAKTIKSWQRAIKALALSVKILKPPPEMPKFWDAAEAVERDHWGASDALAWIVKQRIGEPHVRPPKPAAVPAINGHVAPAVEPESPLYQTLGHAQGHGFFVPGEGGQIIDIPLHALGKASLPTLAPLNHWRAHFGADGPIDWAAASNAVIRQSYRRGVFNPGNIRGRGAWHDEDRVVLHLGDRLLVDGQPQTVRDFKSRYIYEVGPALDFADAKPLSDAEARKFPELTAMLSWHRPISGTVFVPGWCVLAPICGALDWRPHIFLTGQSSVGKSWTAENIFAKIIGKIGLFVASTTTEAGIRRALRCDARPVMIDELEGSDQKSVERVKSIFHLFRYATSETGAEIVMGRQGGGTETFRSRFMGMTSAIGKLLTDYADITRNTTCSLKLVQPADVRERQFAEIKAAHRALLTPAYIAGMQARMVALVPTIRANAETFAVAGSQVIGSRRVGDQIGILLAGRYACQSTHKVTPRAAVEWIQKQEWEEEREQILDTDGPSCFARIMQHKLTVDGIRGRVERSVGELVARLHGSLDEIVSGDIAEATLGRNGIMARDHVVWISNTHTGIQEILKGTPWPVNWRDRLITIQGAMSSGKDPLYFPGGAKTRAVGVPLS